jgi:type II secretory pathway component GspD/PulD (secretin)
MTDTVAKTLAGFRKGQSRLLRIGVGLLLALAFTVGAESFAQPADSTLSSEEDTSYSPQPLITNVFYETDIRDALRDISVQAGIPIVTDPTVQGFVSLEVEGVPLEECLRRLLAPGGFTFRKLEGYYFVGAAFPENPAFALLSTTERIRPNYLKAHELPILLSTFYEPFLRVDEETNSVVITASDEIIERLKEDLAKIDVPPRQVMIEALFTEFSKSAMKQLGVDWRVIGSGPDYTFSLISLLADDADSTFQVSLTKTGFESGEIKYDLTTVIQALAETGEVRVHANPRVVTLEGRPANIFLGREEYYEIITGPVTYPYARLEMIKVGIILKIRPFVAENGDITVIIEPEVSDVVGKGETNLPVVTKRSVSTEVRVKDGETITIGGLIAKTEVKRVTKVPLLGDIPILGYLFSSTTPATDEREVVVFITPHVLNEE